MKLLHIIVITLIVAGIIGMCISLYAMHRLDRLLDFGYRCKLDAYKLGLSPDDDKLPSTPNCIQFQAEYTSLPRWILKKKGE